MVLTLEAIRTLAASVGFPDPDLAAAVAMAESQGDPCANGDPKNPSDCGQSYTSTSFGLWQIHVPAHRQYDPQLLKTPSYNAQAAFAVSLRGTDWRPWTQFTNGKYRQFYTPAAPATASAAPGFAGLFFGAVVATVTGIALGEAWDHWKAPRRISG
jgi:hypothetical protein